MLITLGLTACTTSTNKEELDDKGGLFWKVEKNGTTVYMLGSIHYATEDYYPLHPEIETAFSKSDYLVVESNVLNQKASRKPLYDDETSLQDHLPEELYEDLQEKLNTLGISIRQVERYKPWYVDKLIQDVSLHRIGEEFSLGIDMHFLEKSTDKEIIELEGSEFHINMFDNFSESLQIALLEDTVETELEEYRQSSNEFKTIWENGDLGELEEISFALLEDDEHQEEYDEFIDKMITQRNIRMVEKIEEFLDSDAQTYFFVVGAGHYPGDIGIIHLLEEQGYDVTRLIHEV